MNRDTLWEVPCTVSKQMRPRWSSSDACWSGNQLDERLFADVGRVLQGGSITLKAYSILEATLIAAPGSMKSGDKQRDPEMRQTCNGSSWYSCMRLMELSALPERASHCHRRKRADPQTGRADEMQITTVGLDLAKNVIHLHAVNQQDGSGNIRHMAPKINNVTNHCMNRPGEVDEAARAKIRKSKTRARKKYLFAVENPRGVLLIRYATVARPRTRAAHLRRWHGQTLTDHRRKVPSARMSERRLSAC